MRQFGELEAVIMDRLWAWGRPALVREMVDDLRRDRELAYTTVMTVMENLYRKGWLRRERDGRAWRYEPTGSRSAYTAALMNEALDTSPDRRTALAHFVLQMSPHDVKLLQQALEQASGQAPGHAPGHALEQAPGQALEQAPGQALEQAPGQALDQASGHGEEEDDVR
jgi:predicted transcriptional regulator